MARLIDNGSSPWSVLDKDGNKVAGGSKMSKAIADGCELADATGEDHTLDYAGARIEPTVTSPPPPPPPTVPPVPPPPPPPPSTGYGPGANAPAGLTGVVLDMDGTSLPLSPVSASFVGQKYKGPWWDTVVDPASPTGHALHHQRFAGDQNAGWGGMAEIGNWRNTLGDFSLIYVRGHLLFSPSWQSHPGGGEKIISLIYGNSTNSEFHVLHNNGNLFLREVGQGGDAPTFRADGVYSPKGEYTEIELVMAAQSSPGSADGWARMYMNGVEVSPFPQWSGDEPKSNDASEPVWRWASNANPPGFKGLQFGEYRGGSGGSPLAVDMFTRWGGVFVGGK